MFELGLRYRPVYCSIEHALPCGCGSIVYAAKYDLEEISKAIAYHKRVCPKARNDEEWIPMESAPSRGMLLVEALFKEKTA